MLAIDGLHHLGNRKGHNTKMANSSKDKQETNNHVHSHRCKNEPIKVDLSPLF